MTRRDFVEASAVATAASLLGASSGESEPVKWAIGCFNRPWGGTTYDEALDGMKAAGFTLTGLIGGHKDEPFTSAAATPEYLDALKKRIRARGIRPIITGMPYRAGASVSQSVEEMKKQIDNAARLQIPNVMSYGVDGPQHYEDFYRAMSEVAAFAGKLGIRVIMKPHGGVCATGADLARCVEKIGHPDFRIWYDAGNIIHYTGRDPIAELAPIAKYVTGFCAKDCAKERGEVMMQFGAGKVDFAGVFRHMKSAGFSGPIMIECCAPGSSPELLQNIQANRDYLRQALSTV